MPIISAVAAVLTTAAGIWPWFDIGGRFQGMHTPPFLGGFCVTAIFAATLEYLRGFKCNGCSSAGSTSPSCCDPGPRTAGRGGAVPRHGLPVFEPADLPVAAQGRPGDGRHGPRPARARPGDLLRHRSHRRHVQRHSGRDIIWPYFLEAIEARPLFGFGLGAGKLIVNPEDPTIRLLGSNAAHNEYLRLSVDAGIIGCAAIFLSIIALGLERREQGAAGGQAGAAGALLAALVHSGFDNTLIASTALMQFCLFSPPWPAPRSTCGEMSPPPDPAWPGREAGPEEGVMSAAMCAAGRGYSSNAGHAAGPRGGTAGTPAAERRLDLDRAKGYAILLVVVGHLVANTAPEGAEWYEPLRYALYRFHMPFFLYLSGTVAVLSGVLAAPPATGHARCARRAERLLLPFFGIGLLILGDQVVAMQVLVVDNPPDGLWGGLVDLFWDTGHSPATSVWYLLVLFLCTLVGDGAAAGRRRDNGAGGARPGAASPRCAAGGLSRPLRPHLPVLRRRHLGGGAAGPAAAAIGPQQGLWWLLFGASLLAAMTVWYVPGG